MRNFRFLVFVTILVTAVSGFLQFPVFAQEAPPHEETTDERIQALDQKMRILEQRLELEHENAATKAKETPVLSAGKEGFILKSADGDFLLRLGGILQVDERFFIDDYQHLAADTFLLRVARPIFEGTVFKYYDFRIMPDFGLGTTVLQDAYLDIHFWPEVRLLVGKYKTPFGIERIQNETDLLFVERALSNNLVPNRDVGLQLHGVLLNGAFDYALAVLNGDPDGGSADIDSNDDKDFAARIFVRPFKNGGFQPLQGLGIGVASTFGKEVGSTTSPILPSFSTSGQIQLPGGSPFFKYLSGGTAATTVIANGDHFRISPQGYYYWGPFGLLGEYVQSSQEVSIGSTSARLTNDAWQVAASYVLTGDAASYKGIKPRNPFDPYKGTWGAFELTGRYSELIVDKGAFPLFADPTKSARAARAWAVGTNWYLNSNVKFVISYEKTDFKGGAAAGGRESEKVVLSRFEIFF
jgi:phosphate-selective porin OprO/OprP